MSQTDATWTAERISELLGRSDEALARGILAIFSRQTADEQSDQSTNHSNGRGFNSVDAPFLSSIAKALPRYRNHMTARQIARARPMMMKYAGQLLRLVEESQPDEACPLFRPAK